MRLHQLALSGLLMSSFITPALAAAPTMQKAAKAQPMATTGARSKRLSNTLVREEARNLRANQGDIGKILAEQAADPHVKSVLQHSATNGNYFVVSDLHFGVGKKQANGPFDRQEDFTRGDVWVKTLDHITKQKGNNTLVIGGDWEDILEHVDPEAPASEVAKTLRQSVNGHAAEYKALAKAVVEGGMRIVYIRGNHDIRLVDATEVANGGKPLREHLIDAVMDVANLSPEERKTFKERVAFAGHAAPLGKFGELMIYHGEQQDPTNSWRNPANPYSYDKNGNRAIPRTFGDQIVRREWVAAETANPNADNETESSTAVVAHRILTNPKAMWSAAKLLWATSKQRVETGAAQKLAERIDDRRTLQEWAERTGFADMQNASIDGKVPERKLSPRQYAKALEQVYATQPTPIQERMTSPLHGVNLTKMLLTKGAIFSPDAEPKMLSGLTSSDKLRYPRMVGSGHDHYERIRVGETARGKVGFFDTGTWTKTGGEDRLNVLVAHTGADGRIGDPELFRVNPANGVPELAPRAFEELNKVPGWKQ